GAGALLSSPRLNPEPRLNPGACSCYSDRPSCSAQAVATAVFGVSVPAIVAQPPFSMKERRSQDENTLLNSASFAGASACCRNLSTQIGARAVTTAVCARSFAIRSAALPSVQPNWVKPTKDMAAAPTTAPQSAGLSFGNRSISVPRYQGVLPP